MRIRDSVSHAPDIDCTALCGEIPSCPAFALGACASHEVPVPGGWMHKSLREILAAQGTHAQHPRCSAASKCPFCGPIFAQSILGRACPLVATQPILSDDVGQDDQYGHDVADQELESSDNELRISCAIRDARREFVWDPNFEVSYSPSPPFLPPLHQL